MEQYCLLAKGARGLAMADLIQRGTSDPQIFAFGELLSMPQVQEVRARCFACNFGACMQSLIRPVHTRSWNLIDAVLMQLEKTEQASSFALLRLFSTGTWKDYTGVHTHYCAASL